MITTITTTNMTTTITTMAMTTTTATTTITTMDMTTTTLVLLLLLMFPAACYSIVHINFEQVCYPAFTINHFSHQLFDVVDNSV